MKTTTQNLFKPIVSIRIPKKLLQKIDEKAKEKNTTRSFIINQMLKQCTDR
ncbi:ribbon-helix-helix domain-containing protein [Candidatus Cetobacterium colombiensis]|jgi:metal-responsive CopG/Arc/MetJ family transcriptional regulator|uniref:Ribbon-helix-helix domain-containing protein n=1 Tax=Candidatus Cetobacterium colombiensis TaxID=3073100 RepID=A0ABU4WD47_9FUSO|nr:ribbon-helix-helix domain-containing protein [Candidatus Cetobacterium colombiensis]MDX8337455.1 ribbon-helix-helix domain-containing protein [Candidatus Cetobacterium colombiensis]